MKITKERTRLIFQEYTREEKTKIEDIVATVDKVLFYEDADRDFICIPTGMEDKVRRVFPSVRIDDRSGEYWPYEEITPVKHSASPRNKLQVDFINYVVEHAQKGEKVAGILSPGKHIVPFLS